MYNRVSETAVLHAAGKAGLWRDPDLGLALDWRQRDLPTAASAAQYQGAFEAATGFLDRSRDALAAEKIEAEIDRRWQSGWNLVPIALVVVPFIFTQQPVAEWLKTLLQSWGNDRVAQWAGLLSHLLTGTPALLGYMLLVYYGKKVFRHFALRSISRLRGDGIDLGEALERDARRKATSAVEVHATSYASFGRRTLSHLLDWIICAILAYVLEVIVLAIILVFVPGPDSSVVGTAASGAPTAQAPASGAAVASPPKTLDQFSDEFVGYVTILVLVVFSWLYHALLLASARQATLGMRSVGIFATDLAGQRLSFARATARHFASMLSYYSAFLGFLMQPFNERRQTLHDRLPAPWC